MSTRWVNFSFSDDPERKPKPSRQRWHLPRLKCCVQTLFVVVIFPWLLLSILQNMSKCSPPQWKQPTKMVIQCLSHDKNIWPVSFTVRLLCVTGSHQSAALYLHYHRLLRTLFSLSLSLSHAASKSKRQHQTSWTRLAAQTMITSCTQSQQRNHSRAYIFYLIRSVWSHVWVLILMRAKKPSDRKSVQSRYASRA